MSKVTSFYWDKEVRIPLKYRKVKDVVKSILKSVENDRDMGISISPIGIDYNIKYKYLILECLEKCFELKLMTIPSFKKIGKHGYSDFYLVDIKSRLQSWYKYCLLNPEKTIDRVYGDFNSKIMQFTDLYNTGICEMTYVFSLPQHIVFELMKKINDDFHYKNITLDYNSSLSYNINDLTSAITLTECYDKAEEPEKIDAKKGVNDVKVIAITEDQNILLRSVEKERQFRWNISNLINGLENAYNSDRNYLKESKNINKPTLINWVTNNLNFNEKEIELIKTLMRRKGFNISCEYDKNKQLNFKIESLNDKERRLKNIETMTTYTKMYGYGIDKIDFHSNDIQIMLEDIDYDRCNIINKETKWKDVQFKTVISELSKEYGEYLQI